MSRFRLRQWGILLGQFFTAQAFTQALSLFAGLLLVRFMPVDEFALYTLATSMMAFLAIVTDLGTGHSLLYFFRETRRRTDLPFASFVHAILSLRTMLFLLGAVVVAVALPATARAEGLLGYGPHLATLAVVLSIAIQVTSTLRLALLRLHGRYSRAYRAEIWGAIVRLGATSVLVFTGWLLAALGVLAGALALATTSLLARGGALGVSTRSEIANARRRVVRYLLPILPNTLYTAVQAPLIVWLAAYFGTTSNLAEVGAVTRLGTIFALFGGLNSMIFVPRLAAILDHRLYRRRYVQYFGFLAAAGASLTAAAYALPSAFLWLIGPNYHDLSYELVLTMSTAGLGLLQSFSALVALARSWTRWNALILLLQIAAQVSLVATLSLDTTSGVLLFGLLSTAIILSVQTVNNLVGFLKPSLVDWRP
jgi:O-antigen/teichoic acid export membrane protein